MASTCTWTERPVTTDQTRTDPQHSKHPSGASLWPFADALDAGVRRSTAVRGVPSGGCGGSRRRQRLCERGGSGAAPGWGASPYRRYQSVRVGGRPHSWDRGEAAVARLALGGSCAVRLAWVQGLPSGVVRGTGKSPGCHTTRAFAKPPAGTRAIGQACPGAPTEAIEAFAKDVVDFVVKRRMRGAADA
jgi:hypothetical protein